MKYYFLSGFGSISSKEWEETSTDWSRYNKNNYFENINEALDALKIASATRSINSKPTTYVQENKTTESTDVRTIHSDRFYSA